MKIGLVCPYDIVKGGGVQEIVKAMQAELRRRGHDVVIITPRPQNHDGTSNGDLLFVGGSTDFKSPTRTTFQISAGDTDTIEQMLEREKFDVLHFHEPWIPMLGAQILGRSNAVNVATFHAKLPETMMSRTMAKVITPYTKPILKYIHAFTAVSEAAAEYVCTLTDEPVAIIPNGFNQEYFHPPTRFGDTRKAKTILFVGRLEGRKGVKYLLHALKKLSNKHPDVTLKLLGDGVDRVKLEMLVEDLELDNVEFLGYVDNEAKQKLYRSCDLFCAPSLYGESFGVVLIEAMASGLVTVAGDNPGYASVLKGLGAVSLVNPKHIDDFTHRLELLLYQNDLRGLWRDWAANEIKQYTWERVVDQYEKVYKDALSKSRA